MIHSTRPRGALRPSDFVMNIRDVIPFIRVDGEHVPAARFKAGQVGDLDIGRRQSEHGRFLWLSARVSGGEGLQERQEL